MMPETPNIVYPIAMEEKELEMLIIAPIQTLKPANKKCGNEELFNLVKDSVNGVIKKEVFSSKTFCQKKKIGNRECFSLPKETLQVSHELLTSVQKSVDCSQATVESSRLVEDSSQATV